MKHVEISSFETAYSKLLYVTNQHEPGAEPSFRSGFWDAEEGYKYTFWEEARAAMELDTWPAHKDDSEYIMSRAIQPFGILMGDTSRLQNLVSKPNYDKLFDIFDSSTSVMKEACASLYDIFFGNDDEAAFNRFAKVLRKKSMNDPISVAALYFFLKDKDENGDFRYVPARKEGTGERLLRLDLNPACLKECTWSGYQEYLQIIRELKGMLSAYHPDITLLDAQSFLWMLGMINPDTPIHPIQRQRVLLCNIAWMEFYDHNVFPNDMPHHGGSYVENTGDAFESWNFHRYEDGFYGFVETKYTGGTAIQENANQLHIERIDPSATGDSISGVTVVFCAYSEEESSTVIIGWYENATVLRFRKKHPDSHMYNIIAPEAVLLPAILRTEKIPRARDGVFGFGQSNIRYPAGETAAESVQDILAYIGRFKGNSAVSDAMERAIADLSDEKLMKMAGVTTSDPAPKYTAMTTMRKRNPYLPEMVKRRANGKCELCGETLDYTDSSGRPYLEAHHIVPLADDGADELRNMTALCPNCHKKMHIVNAKEDVDKLISIADRHK